MSSFNGAWKLISGPLEGIVVFTDTYYSMVRMDPVRKRFQGDNPTQIEAATTYQMFHGQGGPYRVSGSTLTLCPEITKNPNSVGRERIFRVAIQGDRMTWTGINQEAELFWQRVD